ncbi:DNA polymerase Y family protein, partial [Roseococcus sp. DSY-14]|uniref:DNA polymerase Y family protein n=1 Tax=Roseococcus sp. DSY-14 TaxID=3369650 RepID=UPI00387AADAF
AAVAGTPGAARAVARFGKDGVVPPGGEAAALDPLPAAALGIPPGTALALRALGVETVRDLAALPRGPLARRFGAEALLRLDRALGRLPEPVRPWTPPAAIQPRLAFAEPLFTAEALGTALDRLVALACEALEARGLGARRLDLLAERVDGSLQAIRIGTARPSRGRDHLGAMLRARLEQLEPGWGIEAMRLHVQAEPLAPEQGGALAAEPDLAALVDRLAARFEGARVFAVRPVESRVPERAARRAPPLAGSAAWPIGAPRPVRLLHPPEPIEAIAALPDHPPAAFTWRRVRRRVHRADGPERIAGEWWRRDAEWRALRDYWAVEDEAGRRYWLFRRGDGEEAVTGDLSWFLHGVF